MSSVHPADRRASAARPPTATRWPSPWAALGAPVDCAGLRSVPLEGPQVLWLVMGGALDLFAVDAAQEGHWHFLGRLEAGTLLLGPVEGPAHTLLGRPSQDCLLRRIALRELYRPEYGGEYGDAYGDVHGPVAEGHGDRGPVPRGAHPLEHAFALGIGRGLGVLFEAPLDGRPAGEEAVADDDILWMPVPPGSVQYGASYSAEAAGDLLVDGAMWQGMVNQQYRLLSAVDRWIEELERAHEDRTAAGIKAGEAAGRQGRPGAAGLDRPAGAGPGLTGRGQGGRRRDVRRLPPGRRGGRHHARRAVQGGRGRRFRGRRFGQRARQSRRTDRGRLPDPYPHGPARADAGGGPTPVRWWAIGRSRAPRSPCCGVAAGTRRSTRPPGLRMRVGEGQRRRTRAARRHVLPAAARPAHEPVAAAALQPARHPHGPAQSARQPDWSRSDSALSSRSPPARYSACSYRTPRTSLIVQVSLAVMVTGIVSAAFMLLQNLTLLRMEGRIESTLQPAVWDRLLRAADEVLHRALHRRAGQRRDGHQLASAASCPASVPVAVQSGTVGVMNLVLLLFYSVPLALAAIGMLVVIGAVFLAMGLWQLRWQRLLVELGNKLNNQAFQTLRGLPKLRVAAAESFAYAAWAREFARSRELQQRAGRIKNMTTVLDAVYLPLCSLIMFILLAGPARGSMSAGAFLTFNTSVTMLLTSVTQLSGALVSAAAALPMFEQIKPVLDEAPEVRGRQRPARRAVRRHRGQEALLPLHRRRARWFSTTSPLEVEAGRVRGGRRPERLRQVDTAAAADRLRQAVVGQRALRRPGPGRPRPGGRTPAVRGRPAERAAAHRLDPGLHLRRRALHPGRGVGGGGDGRAGGGHQTHADGPAHDDRGRRGDLGRPAAAADDRPGSGPPARASCSSTRPPARWTTRPSAS